MIDVIAIVYGLGVAIIAIVGLYKAYKNDNKITREELDDIISKVEELYSNKDSKS